MSGGQTREVRGESGERSLFFSLFVREDRRDSLCTLFARFFHLPRLKSGRVGRLGGCGDPDRLFHKRLVEVFDVLLPISSAIHVSDDPMGADESA